MENNNQNVPLGDVPPPNAPQNPQGEGDQPQPQNLQRLPPRDREGHIRHHVEVIHPRLSAAEINALAGVNHHRHVRIRQVPGDGGEGREMVVIEGGAGGPVIRVGLPHVAMMRPRQAPAGGQGQQANAAVGEQEPRQAPAGAPRPPAHACIVRARGQEPAGAERRQAPAQGHGVNAAVGEQRQAPAGGPPRPVVNVHLERHGIARYLRPDDGRLRQFVNEYLAYQQAPAEGGGGGPNRANNVGHFHVVIGGPRGAPAPEIGRRLPIPVEVMMELDNSSNSSGSDQESSEMQIDCEISDELSEKVFENDMLREMILNHVIFSSGKISTSDLKNIRLVRKSWLTASADSLRKYRLPMFNLTLDTINSTTGCQYVQQNGSKLLETFVRFMTSPTRLPDFIPPFKLHLMPEFFRSENYRDLSDCLISCGGGLVDLDLSFPVNSSMTFAFHNFYLPQLQRLSVQFSDHRLDDARQGQVIHNHGHTIYPLQTVLNGTDELKELTFKYIPAESLIPFGFEYLALPTTITKLCLECPVKNSDLQLLIKNDLPNLTTLGLFATNTPYSGAVIFEILEKFQGSLKSLTLRGHHYQGRVRNKTLFRFPVMEKLEAVAITSQCWEFEEDLTHLERQLPKMNELRMWNTSETMFNKWTGGSIFPGVTKLFVSLINTNIASYNPHHVEVPMTLTLEKMQSIHLAFPNVVNLEMTLWGPQTCGLKYLFMEMRSLQKLAITVKGSREHFGPSHWDALLIGVPSDMATSFRKNPDYWKMVDLKDDNNFPSIRKLTALKSLALVERFCPSSMILPDAAVVGGSLLSDLSFHFAFLKMPNLTTLLLHGKFSPSTQMSTRWKEEKGTEITGIRGT